MAVADTQPGRRWDFFSLRLANRLAVRRRIASGVIAVRAQARRLERARESAGVMRFFFFPKVERYARTASGMSAFLATP